MKESQSQPITFSVRVTPRARRNSVTKMPDGSIKVHVMAPPGDGKANEAVINALAEWLGVRPRQIIIVNGATSRNKLARVTGHSLPREPQEPLIASSRQSK